MKDSNRSALAAVTAKRNALQAELVDLHNLRDQLLEDLDSVRSQTALLRRFMNADCTAITDDGFAFLQTKASMNAESDDPCNDDSVPSVSITLSADTSPTQGASHHPTPAKPDRGDSADQLRAAIADAQDMVAELSETLPAAGRLQDGGDSVDPSEILSLMMHHLQELQRLRVSLPPR